MVDTEIMFVLVLKAWQKGIDVLAILFDWSRATPFSLDE